LVAIKRVERDKIRKKPIFFRLDRNNWNNAFMVCYFKHTKLDENITESYRNESF